MEKIVIYLCVILVINFMYMRVFAQKIRIDIRNIGIYLGSNLLLVALYNWQTIPLKYFAIVIVAMHIGLMLIYTHNFFIALLFSLFSYAIYHVVWYGTYFLYYQLMKPPISYPFLEINVLHFYLLLIETVSIHLLIIYGLTRFTKKYAIYSTLQQYSVSKGFISIYLVFAGLLFFINILLFDLWQAKHYLALSFTLLLSYLLTVVFVLLIIYFITKNRIQKDDLEKQILHVINLEEENYRVQLFRHDYKNILMTMEIFLENNDLEGLKDYFYQTFKSSTTLIEENKGYLDLRNLHLLPVKSLLQNKLQAALAQNISVDVQIKQPVAAVDVPLLDLIRCLGILLDNAIEESEKVEDARINFVIEKNASETLFSISNKLAHPETIALAEFTNKGFSTKGKQRGKGLYSLTKMVNTWGNSFFDIYVEEGYIYCELIVNN